MAPPRPLSPPRSLAGPSLAGPSRSGTTPPRRAPRPPPATPQEPLNLAPLNLGARPDRAPLDFSNVGRGGGKPRSLWQQASGLVTGLPRGLMGFATDTAENAVAPPRIALDLIKDRDLKRDENYSGLQSYLSHYAPAMTGLGTSIVHTGQRVTHPAEYAQASREGRILDAIIEDAGNVAIVGGAASSALGSASRVAGGLTAEEAAAMAGRPVRSAGAMVAEELPGARGVVRAPPTPLAEIADLTRLRPPTATYQVTLPGRGLAGVAERAGMEGAARGLSRAGQTTRTIARYGERAGNVPAAPYALAFRGVRRGAQALGYRPGQILEAAAARSGTVRDVIFPRSAAGRTLSSITAGVERSATDAARFVLEGARIAKEQGLSDVEGAAVALSLDQPGFLKTARTLDDAELGSMLDRMYPGVPKSELPTVEHARAAWAYADRAGDAEKLRVQDQVRDRLAQVAEVRTEALVGDPNDPTSGLHPEQLGTELRGTVVEREQARLERTRNITQRQFEPAHETAIRETRIEHALDALAAQLPSPRYGAVAEELNRAVDEYVRLSEGPASPVLERAAAEVDRLTQRAEEIRQQVGRAEGRVGTAEALTRASGDVETGAARVAGETPAAYGVREAEAQMEGSLADLAALNAKYGHENAPRPEVTPPGKGEPQAVRARATEIGDEQARQVFGEIEQMTETNRPKLAEKGSAEREWFDALPKAVQNRLLREKWVRGIKEAGSSADEIADSIARTVGGDARDVTGQMGRYVETVQRYWDAKSGKGDAVIEQVAADLGMSRDQVTAAIRGKISDYGELFVADANDLIDELRSDYQSLEPDEQAMFHNFAGQMLADPDVTFSDFGELLESFFPGADIMGQEGVLARLDQADIGEVVDWMRGGAPPEFPARLRAKMVERGPAQYRQQGRLAGDVQGAKALGRENVADVRGARRTLDSAQRAEDAALARAERKLSAAAGRAGKETPAGDVLPDKPGDPWSRRTGTTSTGETTHPLSPAERMRVRQGVQAERASKARARANRLGASMEKVTQKIADVETELGRSFQERIVDDLNRPAVRRWHSIVDKSAPTLGNISGKGDARTLTGLLRRLAGKYGVYDDVLDILDGMRQDMRRDRMREAGHDEYTADMDFGELTEVVGQGGVQMVDIPAAEVGDVFEQVMRAKRRELTVDERIQFDDAVGKGGLLEDMAAVMYENADGGLRLNAPHRVAKVIADSTWHMPDDVKTRLDAAVDQYGTRRAGMLAKVYDNWAEAIPARFRSVSQTARRQIGALMEMAEDANREYAGSGDVYLELAEETTNTLADMVEQGIDPVHLTGGREARPMGLLSTAQGAGLGQKKLRGQRARRSGLRQLSLDAYARVEAGEAADLIRNRRNKIIDERLGERLDKIPEVNAAMQEWTEGHSGQQMPAVDVAKVAKDAGWVPLEDGVAMGPQTRVVPALVKEHLQPSDVNIPGWKALKRGNQMWKSWVLPFSSKWMIGNVVGNTMQAALHAGVGPIELARRMRQISKHEGGIVELWRRSGVPDWAPNEIAEHGLTHGEYQLLKGTDAEGRPVEPRTPIGRWAAQSYKLNSFVDNMTRSSVMLSKMMEGIPTDAALQTTLRALGDFTNMSSWERRVVREVLPFYSWMRHSITATLRLPITSPARAAMALNLSRMYADPEMRSEILEIIGSKIPLGGEEFFDVGSLSPLAEMGAGGFPLDPINIARSVSPFPKLAAFTAFGFDVNRMDQAKRPAGSFSRGAYGQEEATSPLRRFFHDPLNALGEVGYFAAQQAPAPVKAARDLALGDEARYATGYQVGDLTDKNKANRLAVILRGLNLPAPYHIDIEGMDKRAQDQIARQRG